MGKTILLHCEQGFGDTLQFSRYCTPLAALSATVILEVPEPLKSLLAGLDGVAQCVDRKDALPDHDFHRRNIPPAQLAVLLRSDMEFYSLQKGEPAESELAEYAANHADGQQLITVADQLLDFSDTAALVANLDLVVTVDTAMAHLTAALGKPVWILNRFDACWRWLVNRSDSPWYPTATLYRQQRCGDWEGVLRQAAADLSHFAAFDGLN